MENLHRRVSISIAAMITKTYASLTLPLALAASLLAAGCSKQQAPPQATTNPQPAPNAPAQQAVNPGSAAPVQQPTPVPAQQQTAGNYAPNAAPDVAASASPFSGTGAAAPAAVSVPASYTIPAGTRISVTTRESISTKTSQPGESFTATVAIPVTVRGATLVRAGSTASGTVVESKSPGRFKGAGTLAIRLDSLRVGGRTYEVSTGAYTQVVKGKGKRTAVLAGGGGGVGALIGGLAGGGKGALIGGLVGAGGGTAGAAYTGNKDLIIPAESRVTFRLARSVTVSR